MQKWSMPRGGGWALLPSWLEVIRSLLEGEELVL